MPGLVGSVSSVARTTIRVASTWSTTPERRAAMAEPRVAGHDVLEAGADERRFRLQERHGLTLHVRAHQRAVGVVVLEERHERRGDGDELLRRDTSMNSTWSGVVITKFPPLRQETSSSVMRLRASIVALAWAMVYFASSIADRYTTSSVTFLSETRRYGLSMKPYFVHPPRIGRERVDQADVRAFRRLDRADAAVMRRMHVAHLEARALARLTARPERRHAALVGDFGERVGLVHELA